MSNLFIPVVLGTAREGRWSERVARYVHGYVSAKEGIESEFVDVKEYARPDTLAPWMKGGAKEVETDWKRTALKADGFIFTTPEYNRGYPGEFKIFLDALYEEYKFKPALLVSVSDGPWGGARVVEALRSPLNEMGFIQTRGAVHVANVKEAFKDGVPVEKEKFDKLLEARLKDFLHLANILRSAR